MMKRLFSEKKLLYQIQAKKDPQAYAALYDAYVEKIYRFVYLKLSHKQEAEDVTSEVFLKAWHYLTDPSKESVKHFSGLVYRIARNSVVDVYRKRASRQHIDISEIDNLPDETTELADEIDMKQGQEQILLAMSRLKSQYQEILVFRYIDELSVREIAEILGKNQTAVRVALHRAMNALKNVLEHEQRS